MKIGTVKKLLILWFLPISLFATGGVWGDVIELILDNLWEIAFDIAIIIVVLFIVITFLSPFIAMAFVFIKALIIGFMVLVKIFLLFLATTFMSYFSKDRKNFIRLKKITWVLAGVIALILVVGITIHFL